MTRKLNSNEKELLYKLTKKKELQPFFFKKAKGLHWFEPLYNEGFFKPDNNPQPLPARDKGFYTIPFWPAIQYLGNIANELENPENLDIAQKSLQIIRDITKHAQNNKYSNYRTWWTFSKILCNLPTNILEQKDMEMIDYWFDDYFETGLVLEEISTKLIPKLIMDNSKHSHIIDVVNSILKFSIIENGSKYLNKKIVKLRFQYWDLEPFVLNISTMIGEKIGLPILKSVESMLVTILKEFQNDSWSSVWRRAIEDHKQNSISQDGEDIVISVFRNSLIGAINNDDKKLMDYILSLLTHQYQTIQRIAIYIVSQKFNNLSSFTDKILNKKNFTDNYRHEMWHFLNKNYNNFNKDQKNKVIKIIESIKKENNDPELSAKQTAYQRILWYSAIKDFDANTQNKYKQNYKIINYEPEHPDFSSYITTTSGYDDSPISFNQLYSFSSEELVEKINTFIANSKNNSWDLDGLLETFEKVIIEKGNIIYKEFKLFLQIDNQFKNSILSAYYILWVEKKDLPWDDIWPELLDFCNEIISTNDFWIEQVNIESDDFTFKNKWIVLKIAELIEEGTRSDEHAFHSTLLPKTLEIIKHLINNQKGEKITIESNAATVALNSALGHCYRALINHSLRSFRISKQEKQKEIWIQYENVFNQEIERYKKDEYEFTTLFGMYIINFYYLSKKWVNNNLDTFFGTSNYLNWFCAIQGLAYSNKYINDIFLFLKQNGSLIKVINDPNIPKEIGERYIEYICIAFIENEESLEDKNSLISNLLARKNILEIQHLIRFFWIYYSENTSLDKKYLFDLWPYLLKIYKNSTNEKELLASDLCNWVEFIDEINKENKIWLLYSARHANKNFHTPHLLKTLGKLSKKQPLEVQEIWMNMLQNSSNDYPSESVKEILGNLITLGSEGERKAIEIIDKYIKHGVERPNTIFKEIKKETKD